ncbi:thiol:disulfide interchange protein DsbA/DsbL [Vibrio vulnificus]|nr:thiol:disulfide interchange protein DsbA/DsbL [Vibrio vulnificus]EHH1227399.1 thiol:disulfide interchange protein DsbA/DsbL [Vibrio vulnificus]HAS8243746.1 thiol:disulfide interchange protein DsbA/DsbL [Vibrio vulnificus]
MIMLNRIKHISLLLLAALVLTACSDNNQPTEGVQYKTLAKSLTSYQLPEVTEVFALTCGHCRTMESVIPQLQKQTGKTFGKLHVTFNDSAQISAFIFYTAMMQLNDIPDHDFMNELFAAVQMGPEVSGVEKQQALEAAFEKRGLVSPYQLEKAQQEKMFELFQNADEISQVAQINSVPTFIVNGKYQVITSAHQNAEEIGNTIKFLLSKP